MLEETLHGVVSGMAESTMPKVWMVGDVEGDMVEGLTERVERTGAIASNDHGPGEKILHRKTIWVKLDRTIIINSELSDRNKVFDDVRNDKNIIKVEWFGWRRKCVRAGVGDRNRGAVADCDKFGRGRFKRGEYTGVGCHVGGCTRVHVPFTAGELHVV
jgi:hypothetical protein